MCNSVLCRSETCARPTISPATSSRSVLELPHWLLLNLTISARCSLFACVRRLTLLPLALLQQDPRACAGALFLILLSGGRGVGLRCRCSFRLTSRPGVARCRMSRSMPTRAARRAHAAWSPLARVHLLLLPLPLSLAPLPLPPVPLLALVPAAAVAPLRSALLRRSFATCPTSESARVAHQPGCSAALEVAIGAQSSAAEAASRACVDGWPSLLAWRGRRAQAAAGASVST